MAVEDIEKRVRAMTGKKDIPDDKQQAAFQSAQNELVRINSERQNNLALANAEANADAQVNETLLQAGEMASMGSPAVQQQVESMNPQTQAVLSKYGLGKPRVQRTQGRDVKVTPQKVQITNNNITNTTNNVSVPPANVGGPVQGRTLAVKQADPGQARFKTWIQNAFAKQNAKAAQREKEYQRREWSLSRSANKMMKYLSDLGSNISEKLNPNKMAATVGGQFKTILFLFGTMFLAKHWKRVIDIGARIEEFFVGLPGQGENGGRGQSGFSKFFIKLFGGQEGEKPFDAFKKFWWNPSGEGGVGVFDLLLLKIKNFFEARGAAIEAVKPPSTFDALDDNALGGLGGFFKDAIGYLANILKIMVAGPKAAKDFITRKAKLVSKRDSFNTGDEEVGKSSNSGVTGRKYFEFGSNKKPIHYGAGGSVVLTGRNYIEQSDFDSEGNLRNNAGSIIAQARNIDRFRNIAYKEGKVGVAQVAGGYRELKDAAKKYGKIPLEKAWVYGGLRENDPQGGLRKIESFKDSGDITEREYRLVVRPRTKEEIDSQTVSPAAAAFIQYAGDNLMNAVGKDGNGSKALKDAALSGITEGKVDYRKLAVRAFHGLVPSWLKKSTGIEEDEAVAIDTYLSKKADIENLQNHEILDVVPSDLVENGLPDGWRIPKNKNLSSIRENYVEVTPKVIDAIVQSFTGNSNFNADTDSIDYLSTIQNKLESIARKKNDEISYIGNGNYIEQYKKLQELQEREKELDAQYKVVRDNSRPVKAGEYIVETATNAYNGVVNYFSGEKEDNIKYPPIAKSDEEFVNKMRKIYSDILAKKGIDQKYVDALVAQDALESNWGKSQSGKFNFGGVTVSDRLAKSGEVSYTVKRANGDGKLKKWRNFDSVEDYADYHVRLLNTDKGFSIPYHAFDGNDVNDFINRIVNNGYAQEGKKYGDALAIRYSQVQNVPQESGTPNLPDNTQQSPTSPDASGVYTAQNITEPENYVEKIPSSTSYIARVDWGSSNSGWGVSSDAMEMATKNATSTVTPSSVTPVSISSSGSSDYDTPSINTAKDLVANNDMTEIAKGISGKISTLNENIRVLQAGQLAQAESINNLSAAIGNIQINVNAGGQQKTPVQGWSPMAYNG